MIKTKVIIEHKIGDRIYEFLCDSNSPLGEIHDSLVAIKAIIVEKIVEEQKNNEKKAEEPNED